MRENACARGAWQQGIREQKRSVCKSMLSLEICRETSCFPPGSQLHCWWCEQLLSLGIGIFGNIRAQMWCTAVLLSLPLDVMFSFLLPEVHSSYLILILSTTAELLMCGKALPRINMIAFIPSPIVFLSALINLSYTYFGLTFSLNGLESTEEYLGVLLW